MLKLQAFFHGCAYEQALDAAPGDVLPVYLHTIDHVFGQNDGWKRLRTLVKELSAAFGKLTGLLALGVALCVPGVWLVL